MVAAKKQGGSGAPIISLNEFLYALGYGINCAWTIVIVQFAALQPKIDAMSSSIFVYAVMALAFVAIAFLGEKGKFSSVFSDPKIRWIVAAVISGAALVMSLSNHWGQSSVVAWIVCAGLICIGTPLLFMVWAKSFTRLNYRELVVSNILSYLLNAIVIIATTLFGFVPSGVLLALLPLLSIGILSYIDLKVQKEAAERKAETSIVPGVSDSVFEEPQKDGQFTPRFIRLLAVTVMVFFVCECGRTMFEYVGEGIEGRLLFANEIAAAIGLVMVMLLLMVFTFFPSRHKLSLLYRFSFLLLITSVLMLPFAPDLKVGQMVPYAFNLGAYQCFNVVIWVSAILYGTSQKRLTFVVGGSQAAWSAGSLLGVVLTTSFLEGASISFQFLTSLGIALCLVALLAIFFVLPDRLLLMITRSDPMRSQKSFLVACNILAEQYSLTAREAEIMTMLASGKNTAFVQEELFLAKSTVNTHRHHIYHKLGVGSQQELINLVAAEEGNTKLA